MTEIPRARLSQFGFHFVDPKDLPPGEDEHYLRNARQPRREKYRPLTDREKEILAENGNSADHWSLILVSDPFAPNLVRDCRFHGLVRIGPLEALYLDVEGMRRPVGLYDSTIISSDFGANISVQNVRYLAHMIVADGTVLFNIGEMWTTPAAKFGNGAVKQGESGDDRPLIALANENGGRAIPAFEGILPADAALWVASPSDRTLNGRLRSMVDGRFDPRLGWYGEVGQDSSIRNVRIICDVKIGPSARINGPDCLRNLTIDSDIDSPVEIGDGVSLQDGLVGPGCRIRSSSKAERFILGESVTLELGAHVIDSYIGDSSTVACGEVRSALTAPFLDQHHKNSFLIAAVIGGQCNIAAGATIGSNHNSRANDGEIIANRGFWPGLCTSLKHNCRFASYTLLVKGDYPYELNLPLPFSLVSNDQAQNELLILPAFWFLHNEYALARNDWKYDRRDTRQRKRQHVERAPLAPDTINEILDALPLLERWTGLASFRKQRRNVRGRSGEEVQSTGRDLLLRSPVEVAELEIHGERVENSTRLVRILKASAAYADYREVVHTYCIRTLLDNREASGWRTLDEMKKRFLRAQREPWMNLGGQILPVPEVEKLKDRIRSGKIESWDDVHAEYDRLWLAYPEQKAHHAYASLLELHHMEPADLDARRWLAFLERAIEISQRHADRVRLSRAKDYADPFRLITYESRVELNSVMGRIAADDVILQAREDADAFAAQVEETLAELRGN